MLALKDILGDLATSSSSHSVWECLHLIQAFALYSYLTCCNSVYSQPCTWSQISFVTADLSAGHRNAVCDWSPSTKMPFPCQVLCNCIPQQVGHCPTARLSSLAPSSPCFAELPLLLLPNNYLLSHHFVRQKGDLRRAARWNYKKYFFGGSGFLKTQYKILSFVVKIQGTTDGSRNWDLKPTTVYILKMKQSHLWVLGQENSNVPNCFRKWITNICIGT